MITCPCQPHPLLRRRIRQTTILWMAGLLVTFALHTQAALTGYWRFDGTTADSAASRTGTLVGVETYTNGQFGQSLLLDGTNYVNLGSDALSTSCYTKAAWVFRSGGVNNNILSGDATNNRHAFYAPSATGFLLSSGHNGTWTSVQDSVSIPSGVWTHVAVTYDAAASGGTLRLYRNGQPTAGRPVATNIAPPNGGGCLIGGYNYSANGFAGRLDEVALWDHALTAEEIAQLYRASLHGFDLLSSSNFHYAVYDRVPEAAGMDVVYEFVIPNTSNLGTNGVASYLWDGSRRYTNGLSFDRLAYYLELATATSAPQWVYVSLDPFTRDARKIAVPSIATGAMFQQPVSNMNVAAGGSYVTAGTNIQTGNIEFWGYNYYQSNPAGVPNASATTYDVGDSNGIPTGSYGSMQIHNHAVDGTTNTETLFAFNRFGNTGTNDLGIGTDPNLTRTTYNPDWTFAQNAAFYTSKVMLILARPINLPDIQLAHFPKPLQLFPRDRGTGVAWVPVDGTVLSPGYTQVTVRVHREGELYSDTSLPLTYAAGRAPFSFSIPIPAELANYSFELRVASTAADYSIATVHNIVAGDVLLVNGQSNAEAMMRSGSANANQSTWVRSFGYRSETATTIQNNLNWYLAEGDTATNSPAAEGPGAVGQWALRMGRILAETNRIPVAILNGAKGGRPISYFTRTDSNPVNLSTNYGRLLYRVQQAGLTNAVRAILWYQGESDGNNGAVHETGFLELYRNWLRDFPSVEKVYVCQLRVGCTNLFPTWPVDLRNRQRLWPDTYPNIDVMSTTGLLPDSGLCHYPYAGGYQTLGEHMSRLLFRDLYGLAQPSQIDPPNIEAAWFRDDSGSNITFVTRNPEDQITFGSGAGADFRVEGRTSATVTAASASGNVVNLTFSQDVRAGTGLSLSGHPGGPPYITNALGVGLLSFGNQPIMSSFTPPSSPAGLQAFAVASNRIDLAWIAASNASHYLVRRDGVIIASAYVTRFVDLSVTVGEPYTYDLAAVNPAGTSAWSSAVSGSTAADNVFRWVPEAADYALLYRLDLGTDFQVGTNLDVPYSVDNSAACTSGLERVAYCLELQDQPGAPLRWAYVSMKVFTNRATLLGVPVLAKGALFQTRVQDMNVYSSTNAGVTNGQHLATGSIEFWGRDYAATNAAGVPNASNTYYDHGDQISLSGGFYGSMQIHNYDIDGPGSGTQGQTILAFNHWGSAGTDDIGTGNAPGGTNTDWTFTANAPSWGIKRLSVLVRSDANTNGLPDAWEVGRFGSLGQPETGFDDDFDHDGALNGQEYLAGTNPNDSNDVLRVAIRPPNGSQVELSFLSVPGKTYALEYKDTLSDAQWSPLTTVAGEGATNRVPDTLPTDLPLRFYRIRLIP